MAAPASHSLHSRPVFLHQQSESFILTMPGINPWDVPHQAEGSPEPTADPNKITVYNMRYRHFCLILAFALP